MLTFRHMGYSLLLVMALGATIKAQKAVNLTNYPGELCNRACKPDDKRICHFEFVLEHYQAMGVACGRCMRGSPFDCFNPQCIVGDGIEKGVMSINRQVPGPAVQVCKGDLIVVDVVNAAGGTAAALHWHGLHMVETPHMDGVPFITQCPIPFANQFRYKFVATQAGTQFYHSHAGHHKINGQYGALIIREPLEETPQADLYDYDLPEHYLLISDWMHAYGEQLYPGLPSSDGIFPDSVLINGRGAYIDPKSRIRQSVSPTHFYVEPGKRYRFRLINSVSHACPFLIQIDGHSMTVIASDSYNVYPSIFDTIITNSGERYDFIINANRTRGDFWIRVRGLGVCSIRPTEALGIIRYKTVLVNEEDDKRRFPPIFPSYRDNLPLREVLNHPNTTCFGTQGGHCITELSALDEDLQLRSNPPDYQFFIAFNNYVVLNKEIFKPGTYPHFINVQSNLTLVGALNNLSLTSPHIPLLTQPEDIDETQFCDEYHKPEYCSSKNQLCSCVHRLKVPLGSIVELVIVDESRNVGRVHHPFHLHGYRFMVTGLNQGDYNEDMTVELAKQMDRRGMLRRAVFNPRPPFKDTISIPSRGYTVLRLRASNPGFWLMHCHYEWHLPIGMGLVLQVGETNDMIKPPRDFPKCGNFNPPVEANF